MDIVSILESSILDLPKGEHSAGLDAILRHVKAAIRHLERDQTIDPDTCTDAIYRTNQAYEGSLKEAYRVLAGKDPTGISPFDIEKYLESNKVIRQRVLVQLSRYRQDYRNPSTHDYKLDFDNDEALLAIFSVCGFAKLLTNQIKSKIASNIAQGRISEKSISDLGGKSFIENVARVCLEYTKESSEVGWFEYERGVSEALANAGIENQLFLFEEDGHESEEVYWDLIATRGSESIGIDVKISRLDHSSNKMIDLDDYDTFVREENVTGALVIIRSVMESDYDIFVSERLANEVLLICEVDDREQIERVESYAGQLSKLARSSQP